MEDTIMKKYTHEELRKDKHLKDERELMQQGYRLTGGGPVEEIEIVVTGAYRTYKKS